jgi:tight adherence protein B
MFYGPRAKLRRRLAAVVGPSASRKSGKGVSSLVRKKAIQNKLKEIEDTRNKKRGYKLREELVQAGLSINPQQFMMLSAVAGAVCAALYALTSYPKIGIPLVGVVGAVGLPKFALRVLIRRRLTKFTKDFADAIDVIVRGVKSGLPVGECMNMIGREMPDPIGVEFRLVTESQRIGLTLNEALAKAVERVPTAELKFFAIVLGIQQQTGGNLADTLQKLSDVLRQRKKMRDKVQAMSSEAKSSAGIIGSLPIVVGSILMLVAPDYIGLLFSTDTGNFQIGVGITVMGIGILVMRQMINFEM